MNSAETASATAPPTARRRAGAAAFGRVVTTAQAPALAAAPAPKVNGNVHRASCQTGTEVLDRSAAVYVLRGNPSKPAAIFAARPRRGKRPVWSLSTARLVVPPLAGSSHEPTLIGEVTLNIRSMLMKRSGRPRSDMRRAGLAPTPASAFSHARRASSGLPRASASRAKVADTPPRPPVKK